MTAPRIGRPPLDNPRNQVVRYRLTTEEWNRLHAAARAASQTMTDYARDAALAKAKGQQ